ncbi:hypothetical protein [Infirmifilum sp. SLHALR2]|nr:MAG: hypothetical protein B7L53_09305 [Thermofilum sp. NZ13]
MILLRHDVDTIWGLRKGVPIVSRLEDRFDVRSTFFVRARVPKSESDWRMLLELQGSGWEIGLHLDNTDGRESLPPPEWELSVLREHGLVVNGVTPHGAVIGWNNPPVNWLVMDRLGLRYMEGYGDPPSTVKTLVINTHLSLDLHYIKRYGVEKGYRFFKSDLERRLNVDGYASVLTHPEWFVRSVGVQGSGVYAKAAKLAMTLLGLRKLTRVYELFLSEYSSFCMRYIDWVMKHAQS